MIQRYQGRHELRRACGGKSEGGVNSVKDPACGGIDHDSRTGPDNIISAGLAGEQKTYWKEKDRKCSQDASHH